MATENKALKEFNERDKKLEKLGSAREILFTNPSEAKKQMKDFLGIDLDSIEETEELRQRFDRARYHLVENVYFEGVFCDILGTLFSREGELNKNLLEILNKHSETKPVNLWTGNMGDVKKFNFSGNGIKFPLMSKQFFKGSTVEIVYDDMSRERFFEEYKILSREYIKISFSK